MALSGDVARGGASRKISLLSAHFVLGPIVINSSRLQCRNVDRSLYELNTPILIRALGKKRIIGYRLLTRFYTMDNG